MKFYLLSYVEKSKTDGHEASLVIFPGDPELIPPLMGARGKQTEPIMSKSTMQPSITDQSDQKF